MSLKTKRRYFMGNKTSQPLVGLFGYPFNVLIALLFEVGGKEISGIPQGLCPCLSRDLKSPDPEGHCSIVLVTFLFVLIAGFPV